MKITLAIALSLLCTPTSVAAAEDRTPPPIYDLVLQKASHNSYARDESLFDQLVFHRVRSSSISGSPETGRSLTTVREKPPANVVH